MKENIRLPSITLIIIMISFGLIGTVQETSAGERIISGLSMDKSLPRGFKSYGYMKVSEEEGHPARSGNQSIRFEVRSGDCSASRDGKWSDCDHDRERHELRQSGNGTGFREFWYHWSIYFPEDFSAVYPVKSALGQFKLGSSSEGINGPPMFMFQNGSGGYTVDNQVIGRTYQQKRILTDEEIRGKWTDVLINVNWSKKEDGFFTVYVNGETTPRYHWPGPTVLDDRYSRIFLKLGIYRSFISRAQGPVATQVVYYDDIAKEDSCEEATRYFDCAAIMANRSSLRTKAKFTSTRLVSFCNAGSTCDETPDWDETEMGARFMCWLKKANDMGLSTLPSNLEIYSLIDAINASGRPKALSKRKLQKYSEKAAFVEEHYQSLVRLVNFSGEPAAFCANPIL